MAPNSAKRQIQHVCEAIIAAVVALALFPVNAAAEQPSEFSLTNGLRIVVVPDHRVPVVTHMVFYKVGLVDEGPGEEHLAHYLEHLMFEGTAKFPKGELKRLVMLGGGSHNAITMQDATYYFQRMPRDALEQLMALEADRMENLTFDAGASERERSVVMEEYRGKAGEAGFPFINATAPAMFGEHPYARPTDTEAGIVRLDGTKAMRFYERHYSPNRAIVVIGGDVTEAEVRRFAEKTYAHVKAKPFTEIEHRPLPKLAPEAQRVVVAHPRVGAISVSRSFLVDSAREMPLSDLAALTLFMGMASAQLTADLVDTGLASTVSSDLHQQRYAGQVTLSVTALPGVDAATIEAAFDKVLAELATKGVQESAFTHRKQRFLADRIFFDDNTAQRSEMIGLFLIIGRSLEDFLNFDKRVAALEFDDVNRVGRDALRDRRSVTGILMPEKEAAMPVKVE